MGDSLATNLIPIQNRTQILTWPSAKQAEAMLLANGLIEAQLVGSDWYRYGSRLRSK